MPPKFAFLRFLSRITFFFFRKRRSQTSPQGSVQSRASSALALSAMLTALTSLFSRSESRAQHQNEGKRGHLAASTATSSSGSSSGSSSRSALSTRLLHAARASAPAGAAVTFGEPNGGGVPGMPRKQVQQEESLTPIDDAEREAYLFELRRELAQQQKEQQSSVAAVGLMPGSSASSRVLPSSYLSARSLADRSEVFKEVGARLHLSERSPAVGRPQPPSASPGHPHHNSHRSARAATARPRDDEGARAGSSRRRGGGSPRRASLSSMTARSFADYDFHPASRLSSRRANTPLTARLAALEARKEEEERARRERDRLKRERARRAAQRVAAEDALVQAAHDARKDAARMALAHGGYGGSDQGGVHSHRPSPGRTAASDPSSGAPWTLLPGPIAFSVTRPPPWDRQSEARAPAVPARVAQSPLPIPSRIDPHQLPPPTSSINEEVR